MLPHSYCFVCMRVWKDICRFPYLFCTGDDDHLARTSIGTRLAWRLVLKPSPKPPINAERRISFPHKREIIPANACNSFLLQSCRGIKVRTKCYQQKTTVFEWGKKIRTDDFNEGLKFLLRGNNSECDSVCKCDFWCIDFDANPHRL